MITRVPERFWLAKGQVRSWSFTLIEMLVVITIIAILAAFLAPALQDAKEQANSLKCINNLHHIGIAIALYGNDKGYYPQPIVENPASEDNGKWFAELLNPYLNGKTGSLSPIFECPTAKMSPYYASNNCHYALHAMVTTIYDKWATSGHPIIGLESPVGSRPYPITSRTSELIMAGDTSITSGGYSCPSFSDGSLTVVAMKYYPETADNPISTCRNADGPDFDATFRFRHRFDTRINLLFLDGHVSSVKYGGILERNVKLDSLNMN